MEEQLLNERMKSYTLSEVMERAKKENNKHGNCSYCGKFTSTYKDARFEDCSEYGHYEFELTCPECQMYNTYAYFHINQLLILHLIRNEVNRQLFDVKLLKRKLIKITFFENKIKDFNDLSKLRTIIYSKLKSSLKTKTEKGKTILSLIEKELKEVVKTWINIDVKKIYKVL